jgi:DNA-binding transcriptional MerR regulator
MLQAARLLGLKSKMTLYNWEKKQLIPQPKRFAKGNARFYTDCRDQEDHADRRDH